MNFSIYIKLWFANKFGKVRISDKYKHLDYMYDNNFISPIYDGSTEISGFPFLTHSNRYVITNDGKKAMWSKGNLLVTRIISVLAIIISGLALAVNYFTK